MSAAALQKDLRKRRRLNAFLTCDRSGSARVSANSIITGKARTAKALIGTTRLTLLANKRTPVRITLTPRNAKTILTALKQKRTVRIVFSAAVTGSSGQIGRATATIKKLRAP